MKPKTALILAMAKALYREANKREMPPTAHKGQWLKAAERYLNIKARA